VLNFESILCQAKSQTEEKLLDSIFNQNLADDVAILKLRDSTKYLKNQQQMMMQELDLLNEKYFVCKRCAITEFCNEKISFHVQVCAARRISIIIPKVAPHPSSVVAVSTISTFLILIFRL
jgi:hypothetical protein